MIELHCHGACPPVAAGFLLTAVHTAQRHGGVPAASRADINCPMLDRARKLVESVRAASFPELRGADIRLRLFHSRSDYFRARFSVQRLLLGRPMRYYVGVNPVALESGVGEEAARAIVAHELCHVLYFERAGRLELLALVRLLSKNFTARFERLTDLEAIARGYGEGLGGYREWLYRNVPPERLAEKRRNYFSPEEVAAIQALTARRPELFARWRANVPLTLEEIAASAAPLAGYVPSG